jgi:hypothetical protein
MESAEPPGRLPLGALAVSLIRQVYQGKIDELEFWADRVRQADFP